MALNVQVFTATSPVAEHPSIQVNVPAAYKILGGGAFDHWSGVGNMLTASYPQSLQTWFVAGKDHLEVSPASITAFALALYDPDNEWDVVITQATSLAAEHPQAKVQVAAGHVLTGGGAFVDYHGEGNMLTASYPADQTNWSVASKDHLKRDPAQITAYAIGLRHKLGRQVEALIQSATGAEAQHPTAQVALSDPTFTLCGGGAIDNWNGEGNLLTAIYPQGPYWMAAGKDHLKASPATITAFAIGIRLPAGV
jgi:vibriolysin